MASDDSLCMVVSIQQDSCPAYDLHKRPVVFQAGLYQTADKVAGMTFTRKRFPDGAYIVMVVNPDDKECGNEKEVDNFLHQPRGREKNVRIRIQGRLSKNKYSSAKLWTTFGVVVIWVVFSIVFLCDVICNLFKRKTHEDTKTLNSNIEQCVDNPENKEGVEDAPVSVPPETGEARLEDSSAEERNFFRLLAPETDGDINTKLFVSDLAPQVLDKKYRIFCNVLTVALLYGLPVVQLVLTYDNVATGNLDRCYYNFWCANPSDELKDYNHWFSNIGYVILGSGFCINVWLRQWCCQSGGARLDPQLLGLPQHSGIDYALGTALIAEGVMSASYHVCPNRTNFQFDTTFMYVLCSLVLLKMYQARRPDVSTDYSCFFLALACLICMASIVLLERVSWKPMFILVFLIQWFIVLVLSTQVYYVGRCSIHVDLWKLAWSIPKRAIVPLFCKQRPTLSWPFGCLLLVNFFNLFVSCLFGYLVHDGKFDFASVLLYIFVLDIGLYAAYYGSQKCKNFFGSGRRRLSELLLEWLQREWRPIVFLVLAVVSWSVALYFFMIKSTEWKHSAALARHSNAECVVGKFYDYHDLWHLLSALALFLSFLFLCTVDDDLRETPRDQIIVF